MLIARFPNIAANSEYSETQPCALYFYFRIKAGIKKIKEVRRKLECHMYFSALFLIHKTVKT